MLNWISEGQYIYYISFKSDTIEYITIPTEVDLKSKFTALSAFRLILSLRIHYLFE